LGTSGADVSLILDWLPAGVSTDEVVVSPHCDVDSAGISIVAVGANCFRSRDRCRVTNVRPPPGVATTMTVSPRRRAAGEVPPVFLAVAPSTLL